MMLLFWPPKSLDCLTPFATVRNRQTACLKCLATSFVNLPSVHVSPGLGDVLDRLWQPRASTELLHHILCLLVNLLPSCQPARAAMSTKRGDVTT